MSDISEGRAAPAVRASDSERQDAAALLQRQFAEGRLTLAELEERVALAYQARTREQLRTLTADLPAAEGHLASPSPALDRCLLICICPPAGLAYWLLSRRENNRAPASPSNSTRAAVPGQVQGQGVAESGAGVQVNPGTVAR